jgi:hypothetical protein
VKSVKLTEVSQEGRDLAPGFKSGELPDDILFVDEFLDHISRLLPVNGA